MIPALVALVLALGAGLAGFGLGVVVGLRALYSTIAAIEKDRT